MWHRDMKWANSYCKNGASRLAQCRAAMNLQSLKNTLSIKHNKAKHNRTRYAYR